MFIENKYTKWYNAIILKAQNSNRKRLKRKDPKYVYYEAHHVIPESLGGTKDDLVLLTAKEHFVCHLLLPKMLEGQNKHKMINALIRMMYSKSLGQNRYHSKSYSVVRSLIAEKNSEMFRGKKKSEETKRNMKGRSGTWIRTQEHRQAYSKRMIGKNLGDNNPAKDPLVREKIRTFRKNNCRIHNPITKHTKYVLKTDLQTYLDKGYQLEMPQELFRNEQVKCPHCLLEGSKGAMMRWHFDNCKALINAPTKK